MENIKTTYCYGTFTIKDNKVLMIKHKNGGHLAFPKGHKEGKELDTETAIRETKEETGIDVKIISEKTFIDNYNITGLENKFVTYYIATPISQDVKIQEQEIQDIKWVELEKAVDTITFNETKKCFEKFLTYWKEK